MKLYITGEIDGDLMEAANKALDEMPREDSLVEVEINSGGGSLLSAMALANRLMSLDVPVHANVAGLCGSAATFIYLAAEQRRCDEFSEFLFHEFWYFCADNVSDKDKKLRRSKKLLIKIVKWLSKRVGLSVADVRDQLIKKTDVWLDKNEAIHLGIVNKP